MPSFSMINVHSGVPWPAHELALTYDGCPIRLIPPRRNDPTGLPNTYPIAVGDAADHEGARATIAPVRRFLSALAWREQTYIREVDASFGSWAMRLAVTAPDNFTVERFDLSDLVTTERAEVRVSLAFYREGMSVPHTAYRFLSLFKILNVRFQKGSEQVNWINAKLGDLRGEYARERVARLAEVERDVGDYLYASGRCAVAHAFSIPLVDPDDPEDDQRLSADLCVIRELAALLMMQEYGLPEPRRMAAF